MAKKITKNMWEWSAQPIEKIYLYPFRGTLIRVKAPEPWFVGDKICSAYSFCGEESWGRDGARGGKLRNFLKPGIYKEKHDWKATTIVDFPRAALVVARIGIGYNWFPNELTPIRGEPQYIPWKTILSQAALKNLFKIE